MTYYVKHNLLVSSNSDEVGTSDEIMHGFVLAHEGDRIPDDVAAVLGLTDHVKGHDYSGARRAYAQYGVGFVRSAMEREVFTAPEKPKAVKEPSVDNTPEEARVEETKAIDATTATPEDKEFAHKALEDDAKREEEVARLEDKHGVPVDESIHANKTEEAPVAEAAPSEKKAAKKAVKEDK